MKKIPLTLTLIMASAYFIKGIAEPWKKRLYCDDQKIRLYMDLYDETVDVPGMSDFGPMNGYLGGNIYGTWMITSFQIKSDSKATLHLSNDFGSETQEAQLTCQGDTIYTLELKGSTVVKRVDGKKLVKIDPKMKFRVLD